MRKLWPILALILTLTLLMAAVPATAQLANPLSLAVSGMLNPFMAPGLVAVKIWNLDDTDYGTIRDDMQSRSLVHRMVNNAWTSYYLLSAGPEPGVVAMKDTYDIYMGDLTYGPQPAALRRYHDNLSTWKGTGWGPRLGLV